VAYEVDTMPLNKQGNNPGRRLVSYIYYIKLVIPPDEGVPPFVNVRLHFQERNPLGICRWIPQLQ